MSACFVASCICSSRCSSAASIILLSFLGSRAARPVDCTTRVLNGKLNGLHFQETRQIDISEIQPTGCSFNYFSNTDCAIGFLIFAFCLVLFIILKIILMS